jgi:glycosyltransferase involved in cell wall biosynthesis
MKFSIITPCLNREKLIGAAIESVLAQNDPNFEHWIIDGGSSDGTLSFLEGYPHLKVISEPDRGVYDGFNKGLERSDGDVVAFLNSDDLYLPGVFELVRKGFERGKTDVVSGGCEIFKKNAAGSEVVMHRYVDPKRYRLNLRGVTIGVPNINARFFRRELFERVGNFSLRHKMAADRDFLLRAVISGVSDYPVERLFYRYRWHAGSLTMNAGNQSLLQAMKESLKIADEYADSEAVSSNDKAILRAWRREIQATIFMIQAVQGKPGEAYRSARESLSQDPRWLLDLLRCGTQAIARRGRTLVRSVLANAKG